MNVEQLISERDASTRPLRSGRTNENPPDIGLLDLLAEDLRTHGGRVFAPGFLALAIHRFGNWRMSIRSRLLRAPLTVAYRTGHTASKTLWAIDLPYVSKIGRRVRIDHHGAVFVGVWSMGDDVIIRHSVTIGLVRRNTNRAPIIGSRVELGPGACVVGNIQVGDDCYVGPNTVLAETLPDGMAAIGVPARQVPKEELLGSA
jgi:serine O-acetyltransferase